MNDLRFNI